MSTLRVLIIATSRKTRGGITSVVKAHETGAQWKKYHCKWIETHRDGNSIRKIWYLITALVQFFIIIPFYNIIHIHVGLRTSVRRKLIFARIAKIYKKKIIIHFHPSTEKHLFDKQLSIPIKQLFDFSDVLIVLSPQWEKWINEAFPDRHYNIKVLYNPCPIVNRNFAHKKNIILYAGTLNDRKGYNRLLKGFSLIAKKYPTWKIVFAGNGEIEKGKELQKELNINKNQVEFLGWITGKEKEKAFQEASIYCLPSWGEGFPMGILDAWAYGIPVITTPVGGITDIGENGKNYLLFNIYNPEELAKCLEFLIVSKEKRKSMIESTDQLINKKFNPQLINQQLEKIYSEL